jgi:hypothetical protein
MTYPPLVILGSENDYQSHFLSEYCRTPTVTFDGISVRFTQRDFQDAFYESSGRHTTRFSRARARKIDWIGAALRDNAAELFCGWDKSRKKVDSTRRIALVNDSYVVVIQLLTGNKARFVTAYTASASTVARIRSMPQWSANKKKMAADSQAGSATETSRGSSL